MKNNKLKILAFVLAVVTVATGILFFVSKGEKKASPILEQKTVEYSFDESEYTLSESLSKLGADGVVYRPTDFDGMYYTAKLDGSVNFFEYSDGEMTASALEVKQVKTNISATYESIPVTVNYIEKDGKACGYGVFTADMSTAVDVYSFAFVKLTAKPAGYGEGYLLLADFDKSDFYKADKLYSEIYNFDLAKAKASTYVSNNTRLIDRNGTFRQDWTLLTEDFIANLGGAKYFLSSRYYNEADKGMRADVMELSNAYRPKIVVEDILGLWFVNNENGMHYLRKTEDGFAKMVLLNGEEKAETEFSGDFSKDYLLSGNYIINKKSLEMTNLMTGDSETLKDIDISKADIFTLSPDGTKAVFASSGEENANGAVVQVVVYCTVDGSADPAIYTEPMLFSASSDFTWLDNSTVMSARALTADGTEVGSVVYAF